MRIGGPEFFPVVHPDFYTLPRSTVCFLYADLLLNFESLWPSGRTVKVQTWSTLDVPGYGGALLVRRHGRRTLEIDVYDPSRISQST
jgi:hypothetical protein